MDCQLCGGFGHFERDLEHTWIECGTCGVRTGQLESEAFYKGLTHEQKMIHKQRHDGLLPSHVEGGRRWNRMQGLMAKGLLVENEAADARSAKGRL